MDKLIEQAIDYMNKHERVTVQELARALKVHQAGAHFLVERLVLDGLIESVECYVKKDNKQ